LKTSESCWSGQGLIEPWHDRRIEAGADWKKKIEDNLESADIHSAADKS